MSSAPSVEEIAQDARWLAQALDPSSGMVRLVAMDRESYRAASFLDDRLMQQVVDAQVLPWPNVAMAMDGDFRSDARWIFHIGHVGSTLLSRLLGEIGGVLSLREPRLLRDLAMSPPAVRGSYVSPIAKLMSRTFDADEIACVKATSYASEIFGGLVPAGERALFMYAKPRNYIASILAGENSLKELHQLVEFRCQRLAGRGITLPEPKNDAERAAIAWACEMTTLESAEAAMSNRAIAWVDFDLMLADLLPQLGRIVNHFGFQAKAADLQAIAKGPLMKRYSKALEYDYSPSLRIELIEQEVRLQGAAIDRALAMLHDNSEKSLLLAQALERSRES